MVGNFIADTVRGRELESYAKSVREGILLHRFIDTFTDSHPIPLKSRSRLYSYFGKYAAVVQDVFYDHLLASEWESYHSETLGRFTEFVYAVLGKNQTVFNERAKRTFHYMSTQDWLKGYSTMEGIDRALTGLSSRASFHSGMDRSVPALERHEKELREDFAEFFPQLEEAARKEWNKIQE